MGIQGLLPFLKAIHTPVNIADFSGSTVAIDAYCWLHRGAFSCAEKLALGEKTDQYVFYCMKYIEYMLRKNLKPILVFDGCHLKSKAEVEKTRRERRELNQKKAAQFLREGKRSEAKECLQRCVDITPQMALDLMNACRDRGVDCIVAPYEADAQLAYLNLKGIADIVVTEDSDLLLFGCEKIIFKMDFFGNGTLIEKSRLNEVLSIKGGFYTFEKFRHMCILSGCDYLPSLPGIGLARACKVMKSARQPDLRQMLKKLPTYLKSSIAVPDEYIEGFLRADNTFLYQLVFDPLTRKLCPLNPYPPEVESYTLTYAGEYLDEEKAFQIALGNIDIYNHKCMAFFDPDTYVPKSAAKPKFRHQLSIWDKNYRVKSGSPCKEIQQLEMEKPSLHNKERVIGVKYMKQTPTVSTKPDQESEAKSSEDLMSMYNESENTKPNIDQGQTILGSPNQSAQDQEEGGISTRPVKRTHKTSPQKQNSDNKKFNSAADTNSDRDTSCDEEKPPKNRKRKLVTTPSKPSAANIGEEAFKATAVVSSPGQPEKAPGVSLTPGKGRNIFAVSSSASKVPKFDLSAHAVQVKSRYFHSSSSPHSNSGSRSINPIQQKLLLSPIKRDLSSIETKESDTSRQQALQGSFCHASASHLTKDKNLNVPPSSDMSSAPSQLKGGASKPASNGSIHKYFQAFNSENQNASDSDPRVEQAQAEADPDVKFNKDEISSSLQSQHAHVSKLERFNSGFAQTNSNQKRQRLSGSSVFSWSKTNQFESHNSETHSSLLSSRQKELPDCTSSEEKNIEDSTKLSKSRCKHFDGHEVRMVSKVNSADKSTKTSQDLSVSPSEPQLQSLNKPTDKIITDFNEDVIELKSCSYQDFLKSLNEASQETQDNSDSSPPDSQVSSELSPAGTGQSQSEAVTNDTPRTTTSQVENAAGSGSDSPLFETRGTPSSLNNSLDPMYCPDRDDIIDLTEMETDHLIKRPLSASESASPRVLGTSKCRVSGLTKNKTKSSKKTSPSLPGQRSIKDLMSKFQYGKRV